MKLTPLNLAYLLAKHQELNWPNIQLKRDVNKPFLEKSPVNFNRGSIRPLSLCWENNSYNYLAICCSVTLLQPSFQVRVSPSLYNVHDNCHIRAVTLTEAKTKAQPMLISNLTHQHQQLLGFPRAIHPYWLQPKTLSETGPEAICYMLNRADKFLPKFVVLWRGRQTS